MMVTCPGSLWKTPVNLPLWRTDETVLLRQDCHFLGNAMPEK